MNEDTTSPDEKEKKQHPVGNLLTALGAASFVYLLTRDKRSETIDTWKAEFLSKISSESPQLADRNKTRIGFSQRLFSKQARENYDAQAKEHILLEQYVDALFERTGTSIMSGNISAPDILTIHTNISKLYPNVAQHMPVDALIRAQKTLVEQYGTKIEHVESKMSPRLLAEKRQEEHVHALEHLFDQVNAQKPKLDAKKRERILSVMRDMLTSGTLTIDPLRTDQFGEVVHEAYQKEIGIQTQLSPEELEHLYTFTEHYRNETTLQEKTKTLFKKESILPTPMEARNSVFQNFQTNLFTKLMQEPAVASMLDTTQQQGETSDAFIARIKTSSNVLHQVRLLTYDISSFRDNLFTQLDSQNGTNQAQIANRHSIERLIQKYPHLRTLVEGATIFALQTETAQLYENEYKAAMKDIPPQGLPQVVATEDAQVAAFRFEQELRKSGLSESDIQKRVNTYATIAKSVIEENNRSGQPLPLYKTLETEYAKIFPPSTEENKALKSATPIGVDHIGKIRYRIENIQQEKQSNELQIPSNVKRKFVRSVFRDSTFNPRDAIRSIFTWIKQSVNRLFSGALRTTADLMARTFARPALSSMGSNAMRTAGNQASKLALRLATSIPHVRIAIIIIGGIFLIVLLMVGLSTKSMRAAQPYEMQRGIVANEQTDTVVTNSAITPTAQPETPYVPAPESLAQIIEFASQKTQTPVPLLLGISHVEAQGTWNYSKEDLTFYNTYGWWTTPDLTIARIKGGYGYDTCTGYIPNDSMHAGEQAVRMNGTICVDYPDGTKSHIMGAMQFNILTWKGFADKIKQELSLTREPDRRVLTEAFVGAGFFTKSRSGASSGTSWSIMEIIKASAAYHTGGTKCTYAYGSHTGNYCREVCVIYNQYSEQYGADPVDCSITLRY